MKKREATRIFPTVPPRLKRNGFLVIPPDAVLPENAVPKLSAREWLTLIWLSCDTKGSSAEDRAAVKRGLCGHSGTGVHSKKRLIEKGYLTK